MIVAEEEKSGALLSHEEGHEEALSLTATRKTYRYALA